MAKHLPIAGLFLTSHLGDSEAAVDQLGDSVRPTSAGSKFSVTKHKVLKA